MTAAIRSLASEPHVHSLGWSTLLVLCETTAIALVFAIWRQQRRSGVSAEARYTVGLRALAACILFAAVTPIALWQWNAIAAVGLPSASLIPGHSISGPEHPHGGLSSALWAPPELIGLLGVGWIFGAAVLTFRLLGGLVLTAHVRRTARRSEASTMANPMADDLCDGNPVSVPVLESAQLDAPVVIGWKRPAIILPEEAARLLSATSIQPLIAHELAHVARHDYAVNLGQSIADVMLFFSPGARWLSNQIREARENCCDDLAVRRCGDVHAYVEALTAVAALGVGRGARPSLSAAGPPLAKRIRRLVRGEHMTASKSGLAAQFELEGNGG